MDVKKSSNFAGWGVFAVGVFFTFSIAAIAMILLGWGTVPSLSMAGIAMVLQGIFYYFKKDNKEDIDNTP